MKRPVVVLVLALLPVVALTGCMPSLIPARETSIQKFIEVPGMPKDVIYEKSRIWIAKTFRSSKAVIEYENKETGLIIGNGVIHYAVPVGIGMETQVPVRFTMREDIKDGKIRITFDNLLEGTMGNPVKYQQSMDKISPRLHALANELGSFIRESKMDREW